MFPEGVVTIIEYSYDTCSYTAIAKRLMLLPATQLCFKLPGSPANKRIARRGHSCAGPTQCTIFSAILYSSSVHSFPSTLPLRLVGLSHGMYP